MFRTICLLGVLAFVSVGCAKNSPVSTTSTTKTETGTPAEGIQKNGQSGVYGSAQEIAAPTGLPGELKSIFSEACGEIKLTTLNYDFPTPGADMLVYVWKNKPTEEKLISAFEKKGYKLDSAGEILFFKKNNLIYTIDWASADRAEGQEIVVLAEK